MNEHRRMYEAIASGNAEMAQELATAHIVQSKRYLIEGEN